MFKVYWNYFENKSAHLRFIKILSIVYLILEASLLSSQVLATPQIFFGENQSPGTTVIGTPVTARINFIAQVAGAETENFESIANGTNAPINLVFPGSTGNITATITGGGSIDNTAGYGRFATSGNNFYRTNTNFTINFSSPIAAFGFYTTDIGDFSGDIKLELTNGGGTITVDIPHTINGNDGGLLFFGFSDKTNSYTSINFTTNNNGDDYFGFDDFTIADAGQVANSTATEVPIFGPLGLFSLISGLIWFGRRRKQT